MNSSLVLLPLILVFILPLDALKQNKNPPQANETHFNTLPDIGNFVSPKDSIRNINFNRVPTTSAEKSFKPCVLSQFSHKPLIVPTKESLEELYGIKRGKSQESGRINEDRPEHISLHNLKPPTPVHNLPPHDMIPLLKKTRTIMTEGDILNVKRVCSSPRSMKPDNHYNLPQVQLTQHQSSNDGNHHLISEEAELTAPDIREHPSLSRYQRGQSKGKENEHSLGRTQSKSKLSTVTDNEKPMLKTLKFKGAPFQHDSFNPLASLSGPHTNTHARGFSPRQKSLTRVSASRPTWKVMDPLDYNSHPVCNTEGDNQGYGLRDSNAIGFKIRNVLGEVRSEENIQKNVNAAINENIRNLELRRNESGEISRKSVERESVKREKFPKEIFNLNIRKKFFC